jgi:hypothetical protein
MELPELWRLIKTDLVKARNTLPDGSASCDTIRRYQEFLDHNELELACQMLVAYAEDHQVTKGFWLAVADAAKKMMLSDTRRYQALADGS